MATKYYRAKKDSFLWEEGAILACEDNRCKPVTDIWNVTEYNGNEYVSSPIIENNPEWFERVYEVSLVGTVVYEAREKAKELLKKQYKAQE